MLFHLKGFKIHFAALKIRELVNWRIHGFVSLMSQSGYNKFVFFFNCSNREKLLEKISETDWWKNLMNSLICSSWNVPFKGFMISLLFSALTNETGYSNNKPMLDQCQCSRLLDESILPWVKFVLFWGHTLPKNQILEIRANLGVVHHMFSRILNLPNYEKNSWSLLCFVFLQGRSFLLRSK